MKYKSPFIYDTPFRNKTSFQITDILPTEFHYRLRARNSLVKDYNLENNNSIGYWTEHVYADNNENKVFDQGDDYKYFLTVFVSKDAELLAQINRIIKPLDFEIILFIEDNSRDFVTGAAYYIQMGRSVRANVLVDSKFLNASHVLKAAIELGVPKDQYTKDLLPKLVQSGLNSGQGHFKEKTITEKISEYAAPATFVVEVLSEGAIWVLDKVIEGVGFLKIDSKNWNYELGDPEMKLFFFPFYSNQTIDADELKEQSKKLGEHIGSELKSLSLQFNGISVKDMNNNTAIEHEIAEGEVKNIAVDIINIVFEEYKAFSEVIIEFLETIVEGYYVFVNAFLCGLWNSIVSLIEGILFLVKLSFIVSKEQAHLFSRPEKLDHFIQLVVDFDYRAAVKLVFDLMGKLWDLFKEIDWTELLAELRVAHVGYVIGAIAEFILEIVVGAIFTGGVASGLAVLNKMGRTFTKLAQIITDIVYGAFKLTKGAVISITELTLKILKAGAEKLKSLFDEIWAAIKKWFDEFSGISKEVLNGLKKYGISVKRVGSTGGLPLATIIKMERSLFLLFKNGKLIYAGTKKQVRALEYKISQMSKEVAEKYIDDLAKHQELLAKLGMRTDGTHWYWKNNKGAFLWWSRKSKLKIFDDIESSLKKAILRGFKGEVFEAKVGREIYRLAEKYGDEITDFSNRVRNLATKKMNGDIDFGTGKYIIEAKTQLHNERSIKGLYDQMQKYIHKNVNDSEKFMNPLLKKVIVVYDDLGNFSLNHPLLKELADDGVEFIKGIENLKKLYIK